MPALRPYPIPSNETARSRTVDAMGLMDRREDPFFLHVTTLVRQIFGTPAAFISLFTGDEQRFLAVEGLDLAGTPRNMSLCAFTVAARTTIVLPDTHSDPRSVNHPVVTQMGLRFSASAPVITSAGFCLGTVCGIDLVPHEPPRPEQVAMLDTLALMVARYYEHPLEPDPAVTQRLQAIARDAQAEFLSLVGHEMRTPLNGIHGMAQVLEMTLGENELVTAMLSSAEHLNDVVGNILSFTELSSGAIALDEQPVSLDRAIGRVAAEYGKLARIRGKSVARTGGDTGLTLTADRAKIDLALSCLMSNFIAHGGAQCEISAGCTTDGTVVIEVRDNGRGITPEFQARIWEAFGVGGAVATRAADGLGLGLPLTRRIVELHGGELDLMQAEGRMTAMIRLPAWRVRAG